MRFLVAYPEYLQKGKNLDWYFVSRLSTNPKIDDSKLGDRALIVF